MELSVLERLVLLSILPREGTVTTVRIMRELRDALSFSEEEHARLAFRRTEDGGTQWEADGIGDVDVIIGPRAHTLICESLERLNKEKKFKEDYLSVWEKFVVPKVEVEA